MATFAAFLSRAYDQIRMAALSSSNLKVCGSHAGVSIGEDGASQMGLEDLAMFRAIHGSTVVYPADPYATCALIDELSAMHGVAYLRATRAATPVLYSATEKFPIGGSKTLRQGASDVCVVVAAGITLHESLKAYDLLRAEGIAITVVDAYSVKPIDAEGLHKAAAAAGQRILVVEDHWREGGLGDAVLEVFSESGNVRGRFLRLAAGRLLHHPATWGWTHQRHLSRRDFCSQWSRSCGAAAGQSAVRSCGSSRHRSGDATPCPQAALYTPLDPNAR